MNDSIMMDEVHAPPQLEEMAFYPMLKKAAQEIDDAEIDCITRKSLAKSAEEIDAAEKDRVKVVASVKIIDHLLKPENLRGDAIVNGYVLPTSLEIARKLAPSLETLAYTVKNILLPPKAFSTLHDSGMYVPEPGVNTNIEKVPEASRRFWKEVAVVDTIGAEISHQTLRANERY